MLVELRRNNMRILNYLHELHLINKEFDQIDKEGLELSPQENKEIQHRILWVIWRKDRIHAILKFGNFPFYVFVLFLGLFISSVLLFSVVSFLRGGYVPPRIIQALFSALLLIVIIARTYYLGLSFNPISLGYQIAKNNLTFQQYVRVLNKSMFEYKLLGLMYILWAIAYAVIANGVFAVLLLITLLYSHHGAFSYSRRASANPMEIYYDEVYLYSKIHHKKEIEVSIAVLLFTLLNQELSPTSPEQEVK